MVRGNLDLLLLAALQPRPAHGYAIIEELRERSGGELDFAEGTVYPALHRLEQSGLLEHEWSTASGRRRRVYELTPRGQAALEEGREDYRRQVGAMKAVLGGSW